MVTDGEAALVADDGAFAWPSGNVVEYYNPYRSMFDVVWSGRRHVVMGATQIDPYGNQNFAAIGADYRRRRRSSSGSGARRATPSTTPRATGSPPIRLECSSSRSTW